MSESGWLALPWAIFGALLFYKCVCAMFGVDSAIFRSSTTLHIHHEREGNEDE